MYMDENAKSNKIDLLPSGFVVTLILTGIMVYRVVGIPFVWGELGKSIPQVWSIPFSGDAFVGLAAVVVTYLLWKHRGLMPWTIGIVFHVVGIKDFSVAGQLMFLAPNPMMPSLIFGLVFLFVGISVQLLCIALLVRNRDYYLRVDKR
jgi:hypothetical protein